MPEKISTLKYRKLVRGDLNILKDQLSDDGTLEPKGSYCISADDIYRGLKTISKQQASVEEFCQNWYLPIAANADWNGLRKMLGIRGNIMSKLSAEDHLIYPEKEKDVMHAVFCRLQKIYDDFSFAEANGRKTADLSAPLEILSDYFYNQGKPADQWRIPSQYEKNILSAFGAEDRMNHLSSKHKQMLRVSVDDLVKKKDEDAIWFKAFSLYGGNSIYSCDWNESERLLRILTDEFESEEAANALGYIYYYGRVKNGKPDYASALRCFTVGASAGMYESMYKIGDMLLKGEGVPVNKKAAERMYTTVYVETLDDFTHGVKEGKFADAADRMLWIAKDVYQDLASAYGFALQADYAMTMRLPYHIYGDDEVNARIQSELERLKTQLAGQIEETSYAYSQPFLLCEQPEHAEYEMNITKKTAGFVIRLTRLDGKMLITLPLFSYCGLKDSVMIEGDRAEALHFKDNTPVLFNRIEVNQETGRMDFYEGSLHAGWMDECTLTIHKSDLLRAPSKEKCFVTVELKDGKTSDYISDDEDVLPGDTVIVPNENEEAEGTVVKVFHSTLTAMPKGKYRRVIRVKS